jgi:ubiquitin-protein ligase
MTTRIGIKRLQGDIKILNKDPIEDIDAFTEESNLLVWYFLIRGPDFSEYNNGYYIGKIIHSPEYPLKAPSFMMLTPNGRFEINNNICLTNSGYHQGEWSAMWNIKTILIGFMSIMLDDSTDGISHIKMTHVERCNLAYKSHEFNTKTYPDIYKKFKRFIDSNMNIIPKKIQTDKQENKQDNELNKIMSNVKI